MYYVRVTVWPTTAYRDRERPCDHTHHLLVLTLEPLPLEL